MYYKKYILLQISKWHVFSFSTYGGSINPHAKLQRKDTLVCRKLVYIIIPTTPEGNNAATCRDRSGHQG